MPQISELFVALGVKGTAKTLNDLSNVRLSVGGISTTALAAGASIIAMAYALQQLSSSSITNAQNIQNLSTYLDISARSLQQWHWTAQQAKISTQELDQSFMAIQQHIKDYASNHKLPAGSAIFAQETKFNFTNPFKADDFMKAAIEFAKDDRISKAVRESILEGWGITPNEISQAMIGRFNTSNLSKAPLLANNEISTLSDMGVKFDNIETKIKMFFSHFTSEHSKEIIKTIEDMTNAFLNLATVLDTISTQLHIFKGLDAVFKFAADHLKPPTKEEKDDLKNKIDSTFGNIEKKGDYSQTWGSWPFSLKNMIMDSKRALNPEVNSIDWKDSLRNIFDFSNILPSGAIPYQQNPQQNQNANITQHLYFQHKGSEDIKNQESHKYAIAQAYRMSSANARTT